MHFTQQLRKDSTDAEIRAFFLSAWELQHPVIRQRLTPRFYITQNLTAFSGNVRESDALSVIAFYKRYFILQ